MSSMDQSLSEIAEALPKTKSAAQLEKILQNLGLEGNLTELSAERVPEEFRQLLHEFLEKPRGELTIAQIRALTGEVVMADEALKAMPLDRGFTTKVNDHVFTYSLAGPTTSTTLEAYIRQKLGDDAQTLINELRSRFDTEVIVPRMIEATLDTGADARTEEELNRHYEGGLAHPLKSICIAIEAICAAKTAQIDLRASDSGDREKGARIRTEALKAGLDEGFAVVLEKLIAGGIFMNDKESLELVVGWRGVLGTFGRGPGGYPRWGFGEGPALQ